MRAGDDTEALLERASLGSEQAIELLFDRHRSRLRRLISTRLDNRLAPRVDPSDVVQDSLTEAYRRLPAYLASRPILFYPWLRQIAVNRLIDLYRKHVTSAKRTLDAEVRNQLPLADASLHGWMKTLTSREQDPAGVFARRETRRELYAVFERLTSQDQEILTLRSIEQLSVVETSEVLGIPNGTVKSRHFRALLRLKALLRDAGWE